MKKVLLLFAIIFSVGITAASAQELGARFGDVIGGNVALDVLISTGNHNKLHGDLSFGSGGVGAELYWDFVYDYISRSEFIWYMGVGPAVFINDPMDIAAAGELGLGYDFGVRAPISITMDWRPTFIIIAGSPVDESTFKLGYFGFNIRYVFKQHLFR